MKRKSIFAMTVALLATMTACSEQHPTEQLTFELRDSLKFGKDFHNPLLDHLYTADPTAIEYEGRLYVYGTNDQQQCDETSPNKGNTYEKINSLAMMSTRDMVNWTYHGLIPTKQLAPWIVASWAPSICSRVEEDGLTHFYLYFSNSGFGTGVLTSTSPVGPWTSPLDRSIVDAETPGLGDCTVPFDPGVVIDDEGTGWLSFGAGNARIAKLGKDMISFDSPFAVVPAPYHFEANELNIIGGKLVYLYNLDWTDKKGWKEDAPVPTPCSMGYMFPGEDPLDENGWKYQDYYLMNPGDDGYQHSNNHTHIHKYEGKWYVFYHTLALKRANRIRGGYRSIGVDEIMVDEATQRISLSHSTNAGVEQIRNIDPREEQEIEMTFATHDIKFVSDSLCPGNMLARVDSVGAIKVKGVEFAKKVRKMDISATGEGQIDVHLDSPDGELIASAFVNGMTRTVLLSSPKGVHNLVFVLKGESLLVDKWKMK